MDRMVPKYGNLTLAFFFGASAPVAATEIWGELDCLVVDEFVKDYDALRASASSGGLLADRILLERTLRGTSYAAYEKIEDQLGPMPDPHSSKPQESEEYRRMLALFRDRCG